MNNVEHENNMEKEGPMGLEQLESFQAEIQRLIDDELAKNEEERDPNIVKINPKELTELEADVYARFKEEKLSLKEYDIARNHAWGEVPKGESHTNNSLMNFYEFIANKTNNKKWMERWSKEKK